MAFTCIPLSQAKAFKKALKDKDIKIADLLNMDTEARTTVFEQFAGKQAKSMNTLFEEKLVLKNKVQGLKNFIAKVAQEGRYSPEKKAELEAMVSEFRQRQQERIFSPQEEQAFLNDLADTTIGTHITREVAKKVFELTAKADALKNVNPTLSGVSDEYLKARNELNAYVESQKPLGVGESIARNLSIIGRNNLLLNPSTPIKATAGQVVNTVMDFATRRLGSLSLKGSVGDLVSQANKDAWTTFRKTGLNTAAMESMDDTHVLGKGENFKVPSDTNAKGVLGAIEAGVRKTAYLSNKVAIGWEHNFTFTKFYQKAFFDMTNIMATNLAKGEGLNDGNVSARAREIFKDAARIEPKTKEGAMVRLEAQKQAARITSTNDTVVSRFALYSKNVLNKIIPGFPLGDLILPIAKIPANIIANGIENAGVGLPLGIKDVYQGRVKMASADLHTRYQGMMQMAQGIQKMGRTVGTLGVAALIASQFTKSDFKSDQYGGHFIKIGNLWVNMEYISAISPALAGMMYTKQYGTKGQNPVATGSQFAAGALSSLKATPGIDEISSLVTSITNSNYEKGIRKYASDFFTSRGEPAFLANLQKDRPINRLFFGAHGAETTTQTESDLLPKWDKNPGAELQQFQAKVGDQKFKEANNLFNKQYIDWFTNVQQTPAYESLSDADKQKAITKKKGDIKAAILKQYGFTYKKATPTKLPTL